MHILKMLNNNVVIVKDDDGLEKVVMGKGLGFQVKPGQPVDTSKIEKIFTLADEVSAPHPQATPANTVGALASAQAAPTDLGDVPPQLYQICHDFVTQAGERLHLSFRNSLTLALADHIFYSLQRLIKGEHVVNALLQEIKQFYPEEYSLGTQALALIKQQTGLNLPEDEAGFIALHLVNAALDENMPKTMEVTRLIADILSIVNPQLGISPDNHSLDYTRFITHLKFFAHRLLLKQDLPPCADFLFDEIKKHYPVSYNCVKRIGMYVKQRFGHEISRDEITFLTVHIERVRFSSLSD